MRQPRVLVVTSCTGEKRSKPESQLTLEDFKDSARLQKREAELVEFACPAGQIYTGQQHLQAMEGVGLLRQSLGWESVDVAILSAGYGLIQEDKTIVPYEVTFNTMKGYEIDEWAKFLGIRQAFEQVIVGYDLVFMLLGENYLRSLCLPVETCSNQTFIFLASSKSANYIRDKTAKTYVLPLSNADAKHYRYGSVGLKGFLFQKFAECVAKEGTLLQKVYDEPGIFVQIVDAEPVQLELSLGLPKVKLSTKDAPNVATASLTLSLKKLKIGKSEDKELIPIPNLPPALNLHLGMQYFIPEWDDRVDPGYNFLTDALTPGRDPYKNDIYAHQIYSNSNYNGILVSKGIVERSKKKRAQIEEVRIHKFIRFSGPVMGDCGAFGYIKEEVPPYNTE